MIPFGAMLQESMLCILARLFSHLLIGWQWPGQWRSNDYKSGHTDHFRIVPIPCIFISLMSFTRNNRTSWSCTLNVIRLALEPRDMARKASIFFHISHFSVTFASRKPHQNWPKYECLKRFLNSHFSIPTLPESSPLNTHSHLLMRQTSSVQAFNCNHRDTFSRYFGQS